MKKRSAMIIAAGLVLAIFVGVLALSLGVRGAASSDPSGPRVRTVTLIRRSEALASPGATAVFGGEDSDDEDEGEDELETYDD